VTQGAAVGDCGIPEGALLIDFAEAILGDDEGRLGRAHAAIAAAMGAAEAAEPVIARSPTTQRRKEGTPGGISQAQDRAD
jgi:hypothetical protein